MDSKSLAPKRSELSRHIKKETNCKPNGCWLQSLHNPKNGNYFEEETMDFVNENVLFS